MKSQLIAFFLFFLALAGQVPVNAQELPPRPDPPRLVNDLAGVLSATDEYALEQKLVAYNDSTSTQIAIVTIQSTGAYDISEYSLKVLRDWGIGDKTKNNGVIILAAMEDRKIWISTGYGMEGVLPDIVCKRIIEQAILPQFKQGNVYGGFDDATTAMFKYASGEYTADYSPNDNSGFAMIMFVLVFLLFLFIMIKAGGKGGGGTLLTGGGSSSWGGGGFSGGGFGGGFGSGGGGGGFGGFGGGSGGGGGAGGSW